MSIDLGNLWGMVHTRRIILSWDLKDQSINHSFTNIDFIVQYAKSIGEHRTGKVVGYGTYQENNLILGSKSWLMLVAQDTKSCDMLIEIY